MEIRRRNQNFSGKGYTDGITDGPSGHVKLAPLKPLDDLPLEETKKRSLSTTSS